MVSIMPRAACGRWTRMAAALPRLHPRPRRAAPPKRRDHARPAPTCNGRVMNDIIPSVHPLHDDESVLERARSLWSAARYAECLAVLEEAQPSAERFLFAARASYALRRYDDALAELARGHTLFTGEHQVESD